MSVVFSGTYSGRFTSDGTAQLINLPAGCDWMMVYNETQLYASGGDQGVQYYWQRGMTDGRGVIYTKTTTTDALVPGQIAANAGFFLTDTSDQTPGPAVATTAISGAATPVVSTGSTAGLVNGTMVRLINPTGALQFGGIDFTIDTIVANTSFELAYAPQIVATATGGFYRIIPYNPIYYPRRRTISSISAAAQAVIVMTVTHGFTIGQKVRLVIPTVNATYFGTMTAFDGVDVTIVAVNTTTNSITVDLDTTGYAFAWPLTTSGGFTPPQVVPIGENTAEANDAGVSPLGGAMINQGEIGITLAAGTASPAGASSDVIYWVAGKSAYVNNE